MKDRALALAGLLQAVHLVQQMAQTGQSQSRPMAACIDSLFRFDADTPEDVFGGAAWNKEWFGTIDDRSSAEGLAGQSLSLKLGSRSTLTEQFVYFANLSDTGEYRLNFDATMSTSITERIGWQLTLSNRYLSNPPPGFESNDLIVTTGVNIRLGR